MPSKYQTTVEMLSHTAENITSRPGLFMKFLETAANNYKYGFRDQLLIFAQKPDATACAEIEVWNKLGRYVKRGTKGIALIIDRNVPYKLRYVFDVSDTNNYYGNNIKLWKMKPEYEEAVTEALKNSFGEIDEKGSFTDVLFGIADCIVTDNFTDYCEQLKAVKHGSFFEEIDSLNTEVYFKELLKNSVAYMLLTRCGYDGSKYLDGDDFRNIFNFNTVETVNVIGCAASDISEMALREIAETVKSAERKAEKNNRTFENTSGFKDNIVEKETTERSTANGADLQKRGGLSSSEHQGTGKTEDREIWNAAAFVSEKPEENTAIRTANDRQTELSSGGDRPSGERNDGNADKPDGKSSGSERSPEGEQPAEMGTDDEQHQVFGGGNSTEGNSLQLSGHDYNAPSKIPYYYGPEEKSELLRNCIALKDHRTEIATFFAENQNRRERGNFIKSFFDNTYVEHILDNGDRVGYRAYDDLITIWKGSYLSREKEDFISWERIADKIYGLIILHEWLSPDEQLLPTVGEQIKLIENDKIAKNNKFSLPQEAIDYVLCGGSGYSQGKLRIYEQFLKQETKEKNIAFLKNEYGTGGYSDAIPESGYWEQHDSKGIEISKDIGADKKAHIITWTDAEKRIAELIKADRYLTPVEKEKYPAYKREEDNRKARSELMKEFRSIFDDYNDFERQLGNESALLSAFELGDCAAQFTAGEKRCNYVADKPFILPIMRKAMKHITEAKTHLTERAEKMLEELEGDLAQPLEPADDELNPPPEPEKEYRVSLGDSVYVGAKKYTVLSLDDDTVTLNDSEFPLLCEEMPREEFDTKIRENPLNDHLRVKELTPEEKTYEAPSFDIGMGYLGNGLTVWNRAVEENGDYQNIAHISSEGGIHYYVDGLPEDVVARIEQAATQEQQKSLFAASYQVGYRVYLDGKPFEITRVDDWNVELMDRSAQNPQPRMVRKENFMQLVQQNERSSRFTDAYREYIEIKEENPDSLVLYQVGDFFEVYGADAQTVSEALNLNLTSRFIGNNQRTEMCGFPANRLETYINMLLDRGFDVTVCSLENGERITRNIVSTNKEDPVQSQPVGRINYLNTDGTIRESIEYTSPYQFGNDIRQEAYYGVPFTVVFYKDKDGNTISRDFAEHLDPPAKSIEIIDSPYIPSNIAEKKAEQAENNELLTSAFNKQKRSRVQTFDLHPDIPMSERHTFDFASHEVPEAGKKERFRRNMEAIRVLKECEFENRFATPEEQEILSQYVGWGGIPEAFDENNSSWADEFTELYAALSPDEYESARASTLTAFYTPPVVISAIYKAMEQMGFREGNILEPSCGIGNFIGMLPDSMQNAKMYGVEIDMVSAGIAQQLYQKSSIAASAFEKADLPDSFFDAVIGNVPFGDIRINDRRYNKHNFFIHDYFFAKCLDKLRPGGVMALITSKGTMDKENPAVRKYIAQRSNLLGAIRLPDNTFKGNAGTEVVSDILILQKRDRLIDIEPDWVHLSADENGIKMNSYFVNNPDMIMGEMKMVSGPHGMQSTCIAYEDQTLSEQLAQAIENIHAEITDFEFDDLTDGEEDLSVPADPDVRNFSYTVVDGKIYYRENSRMTPVDVSVTAENRIKGMIGIRDCVRTLIEYQTEDYPEEDIRSEQARLNELYDAFCKKYGLINSRANNSVFNSDSSYCLLSSLEILDDEGNFVRKADMFTKRTIKQRVTVMSVDTASEALALSLAEKAKINIPYMCALTGKTEEEIAQDLSGVIFRNPLYYEGSAEPEYLPADEYLSGNVREKLVIAAEAAKEDTAFEVNVKSLSEVMPKDLTASEISVRLGATWIPTADIEQFMFELFGTARYLTWNIHVHYSAYTGEWNIEGKSYDRSNVKVHNTYGTSRINGYKIIEETLNLRDVRIFDYTEDENGNKKAVLNKKETAIAQGKQQLIKDAFADWIWKDQERRERLCKLYNEKFNSVRPREYNGEHLNFVGINPEISLRPHQVNAIAHILYGGNTLLAHVVGAGKTFEMVAAAQESKRLGLCQKSLFVVPNHLTEQWAAEYLQLYPSANILVASKKDFETKNRKKFCGRIATGDYDAVIIGHSQFEKIPMSIERQQAILNQQLSEIISGIAELKRNRGENFSVKQLEKARKAVKQKLEKLNDQTRKDDVVTFEELGVDRLFIDEAHYYKNLAAFTKMRNVGGISQTEAQKSSDLYMKCRYLDEITGGKGVVFATGTPISNSMVELYTMQKYLQYDTLKKNNLIHFDSWASTFGETVTAIELAPEGSGYRAKTRFAKFYNLPELMSLFKETADIQTADMLNLPVPKANYHNVVLKPSEQQKEMVKSLSERAEKVRNKMVDSSVDNMLLITNDGRKLALDQRMINEMLPDSDTSKVSACADNIFDIWKRTADDRSAQMVFCDLSTPRGDGSFNVYDDLRDKLIDKGVPKDEIAYIHSANSEMQKKELFGKVRNGQVRVLIGSTQKMGAGTNVQKKLIALHHLDCPWRPSDLQQREGRIIRQGNENPEVDIYTYVTENTFDSYLYQLVESKQKFIGQIMTSKSPVRSAEDVDEQALSYAEIKALCTGNPYIKEKMDLDIDVSRLKLLKANHLSQIYSLEDKIYKEFPARIVSLEERIKGYDKDIATAESHPSVDKDNFCGMIVKDISYSDKKGAGEAIIAACKAMTNPDAVNLGFYRGFGMELSFDTFSKEYRITLTGKLRHTVPLGTDIFGNILRLDNAVSAMPERQTACREQLEDIKTQLESAKAESQKPFPKEEELKQKSARLAELNTLLDMDKKDNELVDGERSEAEAEEPDRADSKDAR